MMTLAEHNKEMMEQYGLEGQRWRPVGVSCPKCAEQEPPKEVELIGQVGIVLTSHPPKQRVRCPECGMESFKVL